MSLPTPTNLWLYSCHGPAVIPYYELKQREFIWPLRLSCKALLNAHSLVGIHSSGLEDSSCATAIPSPYSSRSRNFSCHPGEPLVMSPQRTQNFLYFIYVFVFIVITLPLSSHPSYSIWHLTREQWELFRGWGYNSSEAKRSRRSWLNFSSQLFQYF